MPEDEPLGAAVPNALNHGRVVPSVGVDFTAWTKDAKSFNLPPAPSDNDWAIGEPLRGVFTWQHFGQSEECGVIGHKTGGENQGSVLPVQLGQLLLQSHVVVTGA